MPRIMLLLCLCILALSPVYADLAVPNGGRVGDFDAITGNVAVGENATIGDIRIINGSVRLGRRSQAGGIELVNGDAVLEAGALARTILIANGRVEADKDARIATSLAIVNGDLVLQPGAEVGGDLSSVQGRVRLDGATVAGDVNTVAGPVDLAGKTRIGGKLIVAKADQEKRRCIWFCDEKRPVITIGPQVEIVGGIRLEREAELGIASGARIGAIERAYKK